MNNALLIILIAFWRALISLPRFLQLPLSSIIGFLIYITALKNANNRSMHITIVRPLLWAQRLRQPLPVYRPQQQGKQLVCLEKMLRNTQVLLTQCVANTHGVSAVEVCRHGSSRE